MALFGMKADDDFDHTGDYSWESPELNKKYLPAGTFKTRAYLLFFQWDVCYNIKEEFNDLRVMVKETQHFDDPLNGKFDVPVGPLTLLTTGGVVRVADVARPGFVKRVIYGDLASTYTQLKDVDPRAAAFVNDKAWDQRFSRKLQLVGPNARKINETVDVTLWLEAGGKELSRSKYEFKIGPIGD
jgi:hypothetical protein